MDEKIEAKDELWKTTAPRDIGWYWACNIESESLKVAYHAGEGMFYTVGWNKDGTFFGNITETEKWKWSDPISPYLPKKVQEKTDTIDRDGIRALKLLWSKLTEVYSKAVQPEEGVPQDYVHVDTGANPDRTGVQIIGGEKAPNRHEYVGMHFALQHELHKVWEHIENHEEQLARLQSHTVPAEVRVLWDMIAAQAVKIKELEKAVGLSPKCQ